MIEKNNKDWKERFDEIFANRKVIGERTFKDYHEYLYADILDFIEQIISERDKDLIEKITQDAGGKHEFHEDWQDGDCDCDSLYDYTDFIDIITNTK